MPLKPVVERLLKEKKMSKGELALKMNAKSQRITEFLNGNPTLQTLKSMATALDSTVGELLGEQAQFKKKDEFVYIPILDVALAAGAGAENAHPISIENQFIMDRTEFRVTFPGVNPEHVRGVRVRGDSMTPTFMDKDIVLVDISDIEPRDSIFALTLEGSQYVKRIQRYPGGKLMIVSDNAKYSPIPVSDFATHKIEGHVIGAVMVRRM